MDSLTESIHLHREALMLRHQGHHDRSGLLNNLALALKTYYSQSGDMGVLAECIGLYREALTFQHQGHAGRSHFL